MFKISQLPRRVGLGLLLSWACFSTIPTTAAERKKGNRDFQIVRERLVELAMGERVADSGTVLQLRRQLLPDGRWPGIDYRRLTTETREPGWHWKAAEHLRRLQVLAAACRRNAKEGHRDTVLQDASLRALEAWLRLDPSDGHPNNLVTRIQAPRMIGDVVLLLEPFLSKEQRRQSLSHIRRSWEGPGKWTGQNLLWRARAAMVGAVLTQDQVWMQDITDRVAQEVIAVVDPGQEGLQADSSFHQHGSQLYNGGYGLAYLRESSSWAELLRGTRWELSKSKVDLLAGALLDGSRWMVRGRVFDYGAMGRFITRPDAHHQARKLVSVCRTMRRLDPIRANAYDALTAYVTGRRPHLLEGNRHFWRSDFMVHRRTGFYVSVKMCSKRTVGTERCTGEGLRSYHTADGVTYILRHGGEYGDNERSVFPVWNWRRLPGTTCEQSTEPLATELEPEKHRFRKYKGATTFVGGVSDGQYGVAALDFVKYVDPFNERNAQDSSTKTVSARKAYFFFDQEFVCLGSAIEGFRGFPINTTVNQCLLRTTTRYQTRDGTCGTIGRGEDQVIQRPQWILHDAVGYVFPRSDTVHVSTSQRRGALRDVTREFFGHRNRGVWNDHVFCLYFNHGVRPKDGRYEYVVVPGVNEGSLRRYVANSPIVVLENSPHLQAVHHRNLHATGAAFYRRGEVVTPTGDRLAVNQPCAVLVVEGERESHISVASPAGEPRNVIVTWNGHQFPFRLLGGRDAGKSVTRLVAAVPESGK